MVTNDERMQRESSLIATIRRKLSEFAKACADEGENLRPQAVACRRKKKGGLF